MKKKDFIIGVDFDGTLFETLHPQVGAPIDEMIQLVKYLHNEGFIIQIWTCRDGGEDERCAREALVKHQIPYDLFNENPQWQIDKYGGDCRKSGADVFIDDKNIGGIPPIPTIIDDIYQRYYLKTITAHV